MAHVRVRSVVQVSRPAQAVQDQMEAEVRAAAMVRAAESMMKLVSDIKQFLILNDFMQVRSPRVFSRNWKAGGCIAAPDAV